MLTGNSRMLKALALLGAALAFVGVTGCAGAVQCPDYSLAVR